MQKWEYKLHMIDLYNNPSNANHPLTEDVEYVGPDGHTTLQPWYQVELEKALNLLGLEGWEVVSATTEILSGICCAGHFLMKRSLQEVVPENKADATPVTPEPENTAQLVDPDTPIRDLPFSTRAINCLHRGKIDTLGQLLNLYEKDVLRIRNMGFETIQNIKTVLASYGLSLRDERKLPLGPIKENT